MKNYKHIIGLFLLIISSKSIAEEVLVKTTYYDEKSSPGKYTASGERFNSKNLTAAHRTLPFGTKLKLTNPDTSESVIVRVNDRGPAKWTGNDLDITRGAAMLLSLIRVGKRYLLMEVLD